MGTFPQLERRVADLERRVNAIQDSTIGGLPGPAYGPNVLVNGDIESGSTGWALSFWTGTLGTLSVETTAPLDGARSLKISEAASSSSRMTYLPSANSAAPTIGVDVFPTSAGDTWLISCQLQATVSTTTAKLYAICGNTPADCYGLVGANTSWVAAAAIPLTAGVPTILTGTIAVPAPRQFLTINFSPDDAVGAPGAPWSWLADTLSLQQRTN